MKEPVSQDIELPKCSCGGEAKMWRNMFIAFGVICSVCNKTTEGCKSFPEAIEKWRAMNVSKTILLDESLMHENFGLTPQAVTYLVTMFEFAKPSLVVLEKTGIEIGILEKTRSVLAWLIQESTSYPDIEDLNLDGLTIRL